MNDLTVIVAPEIIITAVVAIQGPPGGGGGGGGAVSSVNGLTGDVVIDAAKVGADPAGTAAGLVSALANSLGTAAGAAVEDFTPAAHITDPAAHAATTQTLTNKTLNSNTNYIDADATHAKVFLNLGGASTVGMPVQSGAWNVANSCAEVTKCAKTFVTRCMGLMETAGADGTVGSVRTNGLLVGVNTSTFSAGDKLYVGTSGTLTATKPTGTDYVKAVGTVLLQHATQGVIDVCIEYVDVDADAGFAFKYTSSLATANNPASGIVQFDAAIASATLIYINETDAQGLNTDPVLDVIKAGDFPMLSNASRSKVHYFQASADFTSGTGVDSIPVVYKFGTGGPFTEGEAVYFSVQKNELAVSEVMKVISPAVGGGGVVTLDLGLARSFKIDCTTNSTTSFTLDITGEPTGSKLIAITLIIKNVTAPTITWPTGIQGLSVTLGASKTTWLTLVTEDNGTTWRQFISGAFAI